MDDREKLRTATTRALLVKGSHEQLMLNPLFCRLRDLNREIVRAEEFFGCPVGAARPECDLP
ncbi:MAG: hypothetical protein IH609_08715 [Dehalococcoidia bacterium]|nr:hypothetical protein [Dehalococcoidia bacterium]